MDIYGYEDSRKIYAILGEPELLAQLADEAAEPGQAALKLRRALDGANPTPISINRCREALAEEYTDVAQCASALSVRDNVNLAAFKRHRWLERLTAKDDGGVDDGQTQTQSAAASHHLLVLH